MSLYHNASKLRCRKMDWMRHAEWPWFTTLIDFDFDLMPKLLLCGLTVEKAKSKWAAMAMGYNQTDGHKNGPNVVTNNFYDKKINYLVTTNGYKRRI